jgi:hypothetical protein
MLIAGGEANFVNVGGRTGIMTSGAGEATTPGGDGLRNFTSVVVPPELSNVEPPANAPVLPTPNMSVSGDSVTTDGNGNVMVRRVIGGTVAP